MFSLTYPNASTPLNSLLALLPPPSTPSFLYSLLLLLPLRFLKFVRYITPLLALSEVPPRAVYVFAAHWRTGTAPCRHYGEMDAKGDLPNGWSGQEEGKEVSGGTAYWSKEVVSSCFLHTSSLTAIQGYQIRLC